MSDEGDLVFKALADPVPFREVVARWVRPIAEAPADELIRLRAVAEQRAGTTDVRDRRRAADARAQGRSG
jgi:hypothetical protein